jgi:hypothetical protein
MRLVRLGMSVDHPAGIFTLDDGPAIKASGRKVRSRDGSAGLMFCVEPDPDHYYDPASFVRSRVKVAPAEVDYRRVTDRFAVLSAVRGGWIAQKTIYSSPPPMKISIREQQFR